MVVNVFLGVLHGPRWIVAHACDSNTQWFAVGQIVDLQTTFIDDGRFAITLPHCCRTTSNNAQVAKAQVDAGKGNKPTNQNKLMLSSTSLMASL